jgi:bla regulator protein blaR1
VSHPGMRKLLVIVFILAGSAASAGADESWVFFAGGDRVTMNGSTDAVERARSELGKDPGRVLWVTRGGKDYAVRDRAALAPLEEPMKRMEELGKKQEILGRHQSTLGTRQSELGVQQSKLGVRMGAASIERSRTNGDKARALDEEIESLRAEMEALGQAQSELGDAQGKLGREQGRLGQEQGRIAHEAEAIVARIADRAIASGVAQRL